jgi:hypothetical protein
VAFSGELAGDRVSGSDLRVCNPAACVEAGLLPATSEVAYSGSVSADGQSVTMDWIGTRFSIEFDSGNIVASCAEATTVEYSFAIHRLEWP